MEQTLTDSFYFGRCKELIARKLGWPPADEWRNHAFTELGDRIFDETGINLSPTTLKRIFGKLKYDSLPSSTTLNTLAAYLGYENWMVFKSKQEPLKEQIAEPIPVNKKSGFLHRIQWRVYAAGLAILLITGFLFLYGKPSPAIKNTDSIVFTSQPITDGLPNSVVFNVDLKENTPRKIVIQQSWDSTKTIVLNKGQKEATGIYYLPGYFRAKLILDGKIVKEHDLFIKAEKWMATIEQAPIPTYIKNEELVFGGKMDINDDALRKIKKLTTPTYLSYHLVKPFGGLSSDNFTLESSIKNTYHEGAAVCETAKIFVLCSKGAFIIPFTIPGCISDINLMASDRYIEGKSNNLSVFGADLSNWSAVKLQVKHRKLNIYFRDKLIHEESYTTGAGEIVGLRFSFLGAGAVQYVHLKNEKGDTVYKNLFEK